MSKMKTLKKVLKKLAFAVALKVPGLTKSCPFGDRHFRWARICSCGFGQSPETLEKRGMKDWHGGVYDFKTGLEWHLCNACVPESGLLSHQWNLTMEEEILVASWRTYRKEMLDVYGTTKPYYYEIGVELNREGRRFVLMSRIQPHDAKPVDAANAPKSVGTSTDNLGMTLVKGSFESN